MENKQAGQLVLSRRRTACTAGRELQAVIRGAICGCGGVWAVGSGGGAGDKNLFLFVLVFVCLSSLFYFN